MNYSKKPFDEQKLELMNDAKEQISSTNNYDDLPIREPSEDYFGIDPFAQALANSIRELTNPRGSVIALNGVWGSGKSSATNLILHHLKPDIDKEDLVVINFTCWWFRGEEALALAFFRELYAGIGPSLSEKFKKTLPKLGSRLLRAGSAVGSAVDMAGGGGAGSLVAGTMEFLSGLIEQDESIEKLHKELSDALAEKGKRFLIVIDDIDRLSPDETLLIFRMVKSVGRLPNVIYLLVYDRVLAETIVSERFPSEGPHYLEKIVQAAFELPEPQHADLCNQLLQKISTICGTPDDDQALHFMNMFYDVIAPEISTPRDVMRLANTLSVTWPAVAVEVNLGDFVSIETLRLFQPQLYRSIRQNKINLCQQYQSRSDQSELGSKLERSFFHSIPEHERPRYRRVLMRIFPRLEGIWNNVHYSSGEEWAKERRICSEIHFDTYFRFSLGENTLRKNEIDVLIECAGDKEFIKSTLKEALLIKRKCGKTKAGLILDELTLHADRVSKDNILPLLSAIFSLGDELDVEEDDEKGLFIYRDNQLRIRWLLQSLTRDRLSLTERSAIFMDACSDAAIAWLSYFTRLTYNKHYPGEGNEPSSEADCLTTLEDAEKLKSSLIQKITDASKTGELLASRDLPILLYDWADWGEGGDIVVKNWTTAQLADDEKVARFAEAFTSYSWGQGNYDLVAKRTSRAQVKHLDQIMDRGLFRNRLEEIEQKDVDATPESIKQFLEAWRRQEQQGNDD
jgi:predicted KAP-like P-loop ATPase